MPFCRGQHQPTIYNTSSLSLLRIHINILLQIITNCSYHSFYKFYLFILLHDNSDPDMTLKQSISTLIIFRNTDNTQIKPIKLLFHYVYGHYIIFPWTSHVSKSISIISTNIDCILYLSRRISFRETDYPAPLLIVGINQKIAISAAPLGREWDGTIE